MVVGCRMLIFTTTPELGKAVSATGAKHVLVLPALALMKHSSSPHSPGPVSRQCTKWFIRAWLAFLMADASMPTLWQVPATVS